MRKIRIIFYLIPLFLLFLFVGCKTENLVVSSKITSVSSTDTTIEFYETTTSNFDITAKAILESNGNLIEEISDIKVNQTTKYSFFELEAETEYQISIYYKYNTDSFIKIATEAVMTKESSTTDISITCENETFIYDGKAKTLSASIQGNYPLEYTYYLEGIEVDSVIDVGEYQVEIEFAGNELYNPVSIVRTLTILPCPIEMDLEDFEINYNESYDINLNVEVEYQVEYYQDDEKLDEKPSMPGTYRAVISILDSNYSGNKEIEFTIHKLEYTLDYTDLFVLIGNPVNFEVEDFVKVDYYLDQVKVNELTELGTYDVVFSFTNHPIYKDFEKHIQVIIDNKKRLVIEAEDLVVEAGEDFTPVYSINEDVELEISYYFNDIEIAKPSLPGIYTIQLYYEEDSTYHSAEKIIHLYIYSEEENIADLTNGLYHITGTVVGKNDRYSFVVNDGNVVFVEDVTLEINSTYDLVGIYDNTSSVYYGSVLKKTKITTRVESPIEVSIFDFEEHLDEYLYKYIAIKGIVILEDGHYALALEENYSIGLNSSFKNYYENQQAILVSFVFYGTTYDIIHASVTEFNDKEKVYAEALVYEFEDIVDLLPTETKAPYETQITYLSSSNSTVISIVPLKVTPSKIEDVLVTITVSFKIGSYSCTKEVTVKVLKEEIKELTIYSIEMHQQYGDSTLITYGDFEILIDAGDKKDGPYVNEFLKEHISADNHLDMLIVTHCHADHMGGLAYASGESTSTVKALDGIATIGTIVDYGHDRSTNALHNSWVSIRNSYITKGAEYYPVYYAAKNLYGAKSHYQIDSKLSLDFIDTETYGLPTQDLSTDLNIYSVATLLTFENFKFFFAGDLEDKGESNLLKNINNTPLKDITEDNVVLYKAAHHGTDPGSNNGGTNGGNQLPFLQALKPDYFFISAAMCTGNYPDATSTKFIGGQPHPYIKCIANFLRFSDEVYYNGTNGTLEFITDGTEMKSIHGYGATTSYLLEANGSLIDYSLEADLKLIDTLWYKKNRKEAVDSVLN